MGTLARLGQQACQEMMFEIAVRQGKRGVVERIDGKDPATFDEREYVQLTQAEKVIKEWVDVLVDQGLGPVEAVDRIMATVPVHGSTWTLIANDEFRNWLMGRR